VIPRGCLIALIGAVVSGCASSTCPPPKVFPAPARPFLWTVSGPEASGRLYLYGTYHAAGADDIPAAALAALDGSPLFVDEVGDIGPDTIRREATLPPGQSLQTLLGPEAWFDLVDALSGRIADEELRRVRPWYAMSMLTAASADLPRTTIDAALARRAAERGLRLEHLETGAEQLAILGEAIGAADLRQALADRKIMRCEVAGQRAAYRAGDAAAFAESPASDQLLVHRNRHWIPRLVAYLRGRGAFVAIGVGHLVGTGSVVELLEAQGWHAERAL
jgi:uncharacterized protein YbaP (TraB family)